MRHSVVVMVLAVLAMGCTDDDILDGDGDGQIPVGAGGEDCDDADPDVYLGAQEVCSNAKDDDCDGDVDEDGLGAETFFRDADRDGYGAPNTARSACTLPDGFADNSDDCDDADRERNPEAQDDDCDRVDDNCDGVEDEGAPTQDWWPDEDRDGFGAGEPVQDCDAPGRAWTDVPGDCDDTDDDVHPEADEICNGIDDDCDEDVDSPVLGDGAACPATSCREIHDTRPETGNGTFYVKDQSNGGVPVAVTCAELPRDGRGWMAVDLEWIHSRGDVTLEKGGERGSSIRWVDMGADGWQPLFDTVDLCPAGDTRWARFETTVPVPFTEVYGGWTMEADRAERRHVEWHGVDNVVREYGDDNDTHRCNDGAILFGSADQKLKAGGEWSEGRTDAWAVKNSLVCPGDDALGDPRLCNRWVPPSPAGLSAPADELRWEIHGTAEKLVRTEEGLFEWVEANPTARLSEVDLYLR